MKSLVIFSYFLTVIWAQNCNHQSKENTISCENTVFPEKIQINSLENVIIKNVTGQLSSIFIDLDKIRSLSVTENTDIVDLYKFVGKCNNLRSLQLSYNKIEELPSNLRLFSALSSKTLEKIDVSHNNIREIPQGLFTNLPKLRFLYLNNNNIEKVNGNDFKGLITLEILFLEHNPLVEIVGVNELLANLPKLKRIFINSGELKPENRLKIDQELPRNNVTVIYIGGV